MAGWHLDTKMAQDIVARTMRIIDTNINVMDARGRIIGSGDRERIGELHEGALLVLSQGRVVDIDDAVAKHLHGVRQGINLPLRLEGEIVGVIGLTGDPESLRKYGELVCMTVRGLSPRQRAWIAWNDATCGLAGKWWRETLLANSAIFTIYHTETV